MENSKKRCCKQQRPPAPYSNSTHSYEMSVGCKGLCIRSSGTRRLVIKCQSCGNDICPFHKNGSLPHNKILSILLLQVIRLTPFARDARRCKAYIRSSTTWGPVIKCWSLRNDMPSF
ncbi:hypothetical protein AVEN_69718-1 [Araneus ventricosus]|uniref:Uncharacterized protein n=1 Tax=Araneus ventricosus TaxID=182803 RepID=A0A4Y2PVM6_ARAVE|nr:hypothetical protein AVEN_69718-1 [Araneus ventricosus]